MDGDIDIRQLGFPENYQVVLVVKKVKDHKVYAEVWANRTQGNLSYLDTDVLDVRDRYGTLVIPESSFDCLVRHLCFDVVEIPSMGDVSAELAAILRKLRKRFFRK